MTDLARLRAETDEPAHRVQYRTGEILRAALSAERAAADTRDAEKDKTIAALRFQLRGVETLIEVEERHLSHDYEHVAGENYEDCSACRWHQILAGIRYALEPTK